MFRFRLQKLLDLREREEQQAQLRLAEAQSHRLRAQEELRAASEARDDFDRRCAEDSTEALRPIDLRARLFQVNALRDREESAHAALEACMRQEDTLREVVLQAHRTVEVLRRLRERTEKKWRDEIEAKERKILDDISGRYGALRKDLTASPAADRG